MTYLDGTRRQGVLSKKTGTAPPFSSCKATLFLIGLGCMALMPLCVFRLQPIAALHFPVAIVFRLSQLLVLSNDY